MSTRTEPRPPAERDLPDLDAEREVDLRRHWDAILLRWWLPVAGLVGGIVVGLLVSIGGSQVYTAKATIYVGQPLSSGGSQVQSQATNPSTVHSIVTAESTIDQAARKAGLKKSQLRGHISTQAVSGAITRLGQNPLYSIKVTGRFPGKVAAAANALAESVINSQALGHYTAVTVSNLQGLVKSEKESLASIDANARTYQAALKSSSGLTSLERLILSSQLNSLIQQRLTIVDQLSTNQQLLALAQDVEAPQLITRAVSTKTTARSRRNTVIVAALIGLLLGIIAALLWEPVGRIARRPA